MRFSRQEYWSELPFPSLGDLPNPGIEPMFPELAGWVEPQGKPIMEYYSAIKKYKIMPFVATWIDIEIVILSEVNQKKTYHIILLIWGI